MQILLGKIYLYPEICDPIVYFYAFLQIFLFRLVVSRFKGPNGCRHYAHGGPIMFLPQVLVFKNFSDLDGAYFGASPQLNI